MTSRPSTAAPILAVLAIVLVTLGAYVGGYFWLGDYWATKEVKEVVFRDYRYQWQATIFQPAASVESWLTGKVVQTAAPDL
jgi:hypothetical protein